MRIAAAQMDIAWHDRRANHRKAGALADRAAAAGADLLVLPEMFATGFSMDTAVTAEPLDGPTPELLRALAREHSINVVGGFALAADMGNPQNVALAVDRAGNDLTCYAKTHLIALMHEDQHYAAGTGAAVFHVDNTPTSLFICYDLRFPELFRAVADDTALMLVIASWPAARAAHWQTLLPARAVENQCYVAGINRVGAGGGHEFAGGSVVIDPLGDVLQQAGADEHLLVADVDAEHVRRTRADMPFLADRRRA